MQVYYDTHKGGQTTYLTITDLERKRIINKLMSGFLRMSEDAVFDKEMRDMFQHPDATFKKNKDRQTNNLQSFVAGILHQHHTADRDFSIHHIEGIELASRIFNEYYKTGEIQFIKGEKTNLDLNNKFNELFD